MAAYGVLVRNGQIVLCRLSARVPQAVGRWTLPGGALWFGEAPADAVVREFHEETGLRVESREVLHVGSRMVKRDGDRAHSVQILYRVTLVGDDIRLTPEIDGSTDTCAWHLLSEAHRLPLVDISEEALALAQDW